MHHPGQTYESYGVRFGVRVEVPALEGLIERTLPPRTSAVPEARQPAETFAVVPDRGGLVRVQRGEMSLGAAEDHDVVAGILDAGIRGHVAQHAPGRIFIHAGAVVVAGGAILLPASSFAGKSTLTAALVAAGATYLSDEYAVLDADGGVWAFPRPIALRSDTPSRAPATNGMPPEPVPVRLVVVTEFEPGATFSPATSTPAQGALALMANAVAARTRSKEVMRAVRAAAQSALVLEGTRGEAEPAARTLLALGTDLAIG